jgi:oxygen-independent coproporphyrinogen III oxidase
LIQEWALKTKDWSNTYFIQNITFGGGTPNTLHPEAKALLWDKLSTLVSDQTTSGLMEVDPRYFSREDAYQAQTLKIDRFSFGVQDFNEAVLSNVNRKQTPEDSFRSKENLAPNQAFGIDLLWGLPKQKEETIKSWEPILKDLAPDWISFYPLAKVPWLESIQHAYGDFSLPTREHKYRLYQWGNEIFERLGYYHLGMGHFIKKNGLLDKYDHFYRKVSGLYPRQTNYSLGLGVSAITESKDHLLQNEKILDRYLYRVLKRNEDPIIKFHVKNSEDKKINQWIENVFTHNKLPQNFLTEHPSEVRDLIPSEWFDAEINQITPLGSHFKKNILQKLLMARKDLA